MEETISINDAIVKFNQENLIISRKKGFAILTNQNSKDSFLNVKSVVKHEKTNITETKMILDKLNHNKDVSPPFSLLVDDVNINDVVMVTYDCVTAIVSLELSKANDKNHQSSSDIMKGGKKSLKNINILLFVDKNLSKKNLLKLYMNAVEGKSSALWELDVRDKFNELFTGGSNDTVLIACKEFEDPEEETDEIELQMVKKCVRDALVTAIRNSGYFRNILDFINSVGVEIDDLVEAGMDLCVGVEKTDDLYQKLKAQILKSLEDINVITLIMAGIRVEEDYEKHRLEEVDVDDDPAYLYTDEVLGMAIANQIAGTKAIFNFKRYDEEKPGIISELGPMLDDIFAGLVAGCMSKIFEE